MDALEATRTLYGLLQVQEHRVEVVLRTRYWRALLKAEREYTQFKNRI